VGVTVSYAVRVEFNDPAVRDQYAAWITGGHAAAVVAAGALSAEVVALDDGGLEMRYRFVDRAALAAYQDGPAVALRADGARRFPAESLVVTRWTGEVINRI